MELINRIYFNNNDSFYSILEIKYTNFVFWQIVPEFTNCIYAGAECHDKFDLVWIK